MSQKYTSLFTVWPAGVIDPDRGDLSYAMPTVFRGLFKQGGNIKLTNDNGQEFYPKYTFWSALSTINGTSFVPSNGDLIARGDFRASSSPTVSAQQIRGQTIFDNSMFGEPVDYVFGTE